MTPVPRRRARRPGRHDRRRGRGGRAGGDDDGHRGGRPVRARPAPPAARPGRPRDRRVVLRPRLRHDRRGRRRPGSRRSPRSATASSSRSGTSSCAARATCWVSPRAACRGSASPRSRTRRTGSSRSARARTPRRSSTTRGALIDGVDALRHELDDGLAAAGLRRRAGGRRRGRRWLTPGRVIAGTARGHPPRRRPAAGRGRWATASSRRCSRSSSRTCPAPAFLDLFAGSGAAGIEALSRGAARATFVERDAAAIRVIGANLERDPPRRAGRPRSCTRTRSRWLGVAGAAPTTRRWDVVVVDPPYDRPELLSGRARRPLGPLARARRPGRGQALLARRRRRPGSGC